MYTVLILIAICIIIFYIWSESILGGLFYGVLIGSLSGFLLSSVLTVIFKPKVITKKECLYYIYSLQDNSNVNGNFTVGCGRINEKTVYSFYIKSDYGYIQESLPSDECAIVEENRAKIN